MMLAVRCAASLGTLGRSHIGLVRVRERFLPLLQYGTTQFHPYLTIPGGDLCPEPRRHQRLSQQVRAYCQNVQSTTTASSTSTITRDTLAAKRKVFQDKKATLDRRRAQVTARVRQAKCLAKQRINIYRENIVTIPNLLSVSRILSTPLLGYWVCTGLYSSALGLFVYAAVTDLLDGQIARSWPSQQSMAGTVLDPLADKLLVGTLFLTLTYAGLIPVQLTALAIFRDAGLMAASFYLRFKSLPKPKTLTRYFDPSIASMKFEPTFLSKANTTIQLGLCATTLGAAVFQYTDHPAFYTLWWLTAVTTFASGLEYAIRKDTYRFLDKSEKKPK